MGRGILRPSHHRRLEEAARLHHEDLPRPRPAPGRPSRPPARRQRLFGLSGRSRVVHREQREGAAPLVLLPGVISAEGPDRRGSGSLERHHDAPRAAPRITSRRHQGVRAGGAARGLLSAHGNPRGARPPLSGLQHGTLGLHQQRRRCACMGPELHQPQHRCHHDDVRVHADL